MGGDAWSRDGAAGCVLFEPGNSFPGQPVPVNQPVTSNRMCADPYVYTWALPPAATGVTTAFAMVWPSYEVLRLEDSPSDAGVDGSCR